MPGTTYPRRMRQKRTPLAASAGVRPHIHKRGLRWPRVDAYAHPVRIEFTFSRGPEYFREQLRRGAMLAVRRMLLLGAVLAVAGALAVLLGQGEGAATVVGAGAVLMAVLLPLRARRTFVAAVTVPASWCGLRTYVITDEELESSSEMTSVRWRWTAVRRVEVRPAAYLFWQDGPAVFDLPREPLTPGQEAELRVHLTGLGLLPRVI